MGHSVSVLVAVLQRWTARELRAVALETLLALTGLREGERYSFTSERKTERFQYSRIVPGCVGVTEVTGGDLKSLQERVGRGREEVASFLPGVTTAVCKLITSDPHLGQVGNS